jgi:hypothetical protein
MESQKVKNLDKKRCYKSPKIEQIKLDNEISMVMMSVPGDPNTMPSQEPSFIGSLRILKLFK